MGQDRISERQERHETKTATTETDGERNRSEYASTLKAGNLAEQNRNNELVEKYLDPDEKNKFQITNNEQSKKTQEWTVAVNLAASLPGGGGGSTAKMEQIKQLAAETKDKSLTILAQSSEPNPAYKDGNGQSQYLLHRYEIKDGKATELAIKPAKSYDENVSDLLHEAAIRDPSKKLGLILQSDGKGNQGMRGATGDTTPETLTKSIKESLKGTGHDKLDVLDFDACAMAETGVLNKTSKIAKNVVASAELESSAGSPGGPDGQNLGAVLSALAKNPQMDGGEFGDTIVAESRKPPAKPTIPASTEANTTLTPASEKNGANEMPQPLTNSEIQGVSTIANFDQANQKKFHNALNEFGEELAKSARDAKNKQAIDDIITKTPRYAAILDKDETRGAEDRDLKTFAQQIEKGVQEGTISDPDGRLNRSAKEVLNAQSALTRSSYGAQPDRDNANDYGQLGKLSVFLPGKDFRDSEATARRMNPLNYLAAQTSQEYQGKDPNEDPRFGPQFRETWQSQLDDKLKDLKQRAPANEQAALKPLEDAIAKMHSASSGAAFQDSLKEINKISNKLKTDPFSDAVAKTYMRDAEETKKKTFQNDKNSSETGWNHFVQTMNTPAANR